jgi:hypothetical protein
MATTILWSASTATRAPIPANNRGTSKNKCYKQLNCKYGDGNESNISKFGYRIR